MNSRIWAERPLIDLFRRARFGIHDISPYPDRETIILSRGQRTRVEYDDTSDTVAMREQMVAYNKLLHETFVDVPSLDVPVVTKPPERPNGRPTNIWISQNDKFSERIFYRGRLSLGGRIHGGFWQRLPEEERGKLFINDVAVIEDDYSGTHIAILYGLEGVPLLGDPYAVDLPSTFSTSQLRDWVKCLALVVINAGSEESAFKAFRQKQPAGSPAKHFTNAQLSQLLRAFEKRHPAIAQSFCSDRGVELMTIDGRITAKIIDQFTRERIPILTVFDSYIIDIFHAEELRASMLEALDAEVPGAATNINRTGKSFEDLRAMIKTEKDLMHLLTMDIVASRSKGYVARRDEFGKWLSSQGVQWGSDVMLRQTLEQVTKRGEQGLC